jgi:hypothetical protein
MCSKDSGAHAAPPPFSAVRTAATAADAAERLRRVRRSRRRRGAGPRVIALSDRHRIAVITCGSWVIVA